MCAFKEMYLFETQKGRDRSKEIFNLLIHSLNSHKNQLWPKPKPGASSSYLSLQKQLLPLHTVPFLVAFGRLTTKEIGTGCTTDVIGIIIPPNSC